MYIRVLNSTPPEISYTATRTWKSITPCRADKINFPTARACIITLSREKHAVAKRSTHVIPRPNRKGNRYPSRPWGTRKRESYIGNACDPPITRLTADIPRRAVDCRFCLIPHSLSLSAVCMCVCPLYIPSERENNEALMGSSLSETGVGVSYLYTYIRRCNYRFGHWKSRLLRIGHTVYICTCGHAAEFVSPVAGVYTRFRIRFSRL